MRRSVILYIAGSIAVLCIIAAVYFLVPGIVHPYLAVRNGAFGFVDPGKHPSIVKSAHRLYAAAFFVLAVISAALAYLFVGKKAVKAA